MNVSETDALQAQREAYMKHLGPLDFTEAVAMHLDNIVGRTLQDAATILTELECSYRVVSRDGVDDYIAPKPKSLHRVNLHLEQGVVKSFYTG